MELELAKSSGTSSVDGPLRDPLMIEMTDLLAVVKVLECCRTPRTRPQRDIGLLQNSVRFSTTKSSGSRVRCRCALYVVAAGLTHCDLRAKVRCEGGLVVLFDGELGHLTLLGIAHCGVDHCERSECDLCPDDGGTSPERATRRRRASWQAYLSVPLLP